MQNHGVQLPAGDSTITDFTLSYESMYEHGDTAGILNLDVIQAGDQLQLSNLTGEENTRGRKEEYIILTALHESTRDPDTNQLETIAFRVDHLSRAAKRRISFSPADVDDSGHIIIELIGSLKNGVIYPGRIVPGVGVLFTTKTGLFVTWPVNQAAILETVESGEKMAHYQSGISFPQMEYESRLVPNEIELNTEYMGQGVVLALDELRQRIDTEVTQGLEALGYTQSPRIMFHIPIDGRGEYDEVIVAGESVLTNEGRVNEINTIRIARQHHRYQLDNLSMRYSGESCWRLALGHMEGEEEIYDTYYTLSNNPLTNGTFLVELGEIEGWRPYILSELSGLTFMGRIDLPTGEVQGTFEPSMPNANDILTVGPEIRSRYNNEFRVTTTDNRVTFHKGNSKRPISRHFASPSSRLQAAIIVALRQRSLTISLRKTE